MSLRRVGGKGDGGVDLQGWWWLPAERLRVVAQCKAEEKKVGPRYIREFEGTVLRHSAYLIPNDRDRRAAQGLRDALVGLFVSSSPFTKASLLQAYSSPIPLALLHLPEPEPTVASDASGTDHAKVHAAGDTLSGTLVFNPALGGPSGLLRGTIEPRWQRSLTSTNGSWGMWSNGERIRSWTPDGDEERSNGLV
ncbi:hypothetical protein C8Q77DRAFT_1054262 [Trametes polyzona]|nr:hypothetical protein C8Q77DRAFT_1054262 [Trametes polyzona]